MIEIKLYEYQVHEILTILKSRISEFKEQKEKEENKCILSSIEIKISIYEKIKNVLEDSLNRE